MAQIKIEDLEFQYPNAKKKALKKINMEIEAGDFVLVCGKSGCGKTTLLKNIKNSIAPYGTKEGNIYVNGVKIQEMDAKEEAEKIGYVFQQPQHQLVAQNVWNELFFGLENIGVEKHESKLKVAEVSDYFGFSDKLYREVNKLSGGQKQLLNVASIMAMQPEIIIFDEPTAQLDPIAAENLLTAIYNINRDFGVTIIISEHRLDKLLYMATKVIVLEDGEIVNEGSPKEVAKQTLGTPFFEAMPESVKLYGEYIEKKGVISESQIWPLTLVEAKKWISKLTEEDKALVKSIIKESIFEKKSKSNKVAIDINKVWFRYEKNQGDVLKEATAQIFEEEIFGIVGGNGSGKSTLLNIMSKINKPYRGKVSTNGNVSMMVQDVTCIFQQDTVRGELELMNNKESIDTVVRQMELQELLEIHPYDLSGGEQQRLAMAKLLLTSPDIIILDEPTKGMDDVFKNTFAKLLANLKENGKTIVIVSHDIEFLAKVADRCGMIFDGEIISIEKTEKFFEGKRYYTTEYNKIIR